MATNLVLLAEPTRQEGRDRATQPVVAALPQSTHSQTASASEPGDWLYWLVPILAVVGLLLYFVGLVPQQRLAEPTEVDLARIDVANIEIGKQFRAAIADLNATLSAITDVGSAEAALPRLRTIAGQIDQAGIVIGQFSTEQRTAFSGLVNSLRPGLDEIVANVMAVSGVADVLKPTVDALTAKVSAIAS